MDGLQFLDEYYGNPKSYLPLSSQAGKTFLPRDPEHGDVNIGWNCGLIEPNRPYFSECWAAEGITMMTFKFSSEGLDGWTGEQIEELCEKNNLYHKYPDAPGNAIVPYIAENGDPFLSVNVVVGIEDETYVDSTSGFYSFSMLYEYNQKRIHGKHADVSGN